MGVAKNLDAILGLADPIEFVKRKAESIWSQPAADGFTSLGLRGTTRIQRTVPFGEAWFRP